MRTKLSKENPFSYDRYGFLWEKIKTSDSKPGHHFDYGAYDGRIIAMLQEGSIIQSGVGVDVNAEVINNTMYEGIQLIAIKQKSRLPFGDESFDSASILDVLEHIVDQEKVLCEINRVLRPNGVLIITVPGKHFFSFLDMGNFKFYFPKLHRFYYTRKYSLEEYKKRYVDCENGLFGDIELGKNKHQHFTKKELQSLLVRCGFNVIEFDGSGLFMRLLSIIDYFIPTPLNKVTKRLLNLDARLMDQANLFCLASKQCIKGEVV